MLKNRCILVVDDEQNLVRGIYDFLSANNFDVISAYNGEDALDILYEKNKDIDLIILDVMMPKLSGIEVLKELRSYGIFTPVIMLTAKGEEYDQLEGFKNGADDYITKPFSISLLLARIESVLKRIGKGKDEIIICNNIKIDINKRVVTNNNEILDLTKREFDLLLFLISNKNMILSREALLSSVWGFNFEGATRTVDTHIKQLRIKLKDESKYIKTIHKVGYKFEEEV